MMTSFKAKTLKLEPNAECLKWPTDNLEPHYFVRRPPRDGRNYLPHITKAKTAAEAWKLAYTHISAEAAL